MKKRPTKPSKRRRPRPQRAYHGHFTKHSAAKFGAIGGSRRKRTLSKAARRRIARLGGLAAAKAARRRAA